MEVKKKINTKFFLEIFFPLINIGIIFCFCLWYKELSFTWDSRMYLALLVAVFFNYFLLYAHNRHIDKEQKYSIIRLHVIVWEIAVPILVMVLVIVSIIYENQFYNEELFLKSSNFGAFYILIVVIALFLFFLVRAIRLAVHIKSKKIVVKVINNGVVPN
jgi:hypothetical protein